MMDARAIAQRVAANRAQQVNNLQGAYTQAKERADQLYAVKEGRLARVETVKAEREIVNRHDFDLFPTPESLADRMVEIGGITGGAKVLEPSAGTGRLALAAKKVGAIVHCVEIQSRAADYLRGQGLAVDRDDFMTWDTSERFGVVLMNPPFSNSQDIDHVMRAYGFIVHYGAVVAIMGAGAFLRDDRKAREFRAWLDTVGGESEELPEGTFKASGTMVNSRLVTIHKF